MSVMQLERQTHLVWFPNCRKRRFVYQLEAVTETQPLFLKQHLEAANGAVVTVQHQHGQGGELSCAVPAVATVHHTDVFPDSTLSAIRSAPARISYKHTNNLVKRL